MFLIFLLYALSASSLTVGKAIFEYAQPFFFLATRMIVVGLLLLLFVRYKKERIVIAKEDRWYFFCMALFHIFLAFGLELVALRSMPSYQVALLYNLSPFFTALGSYFYFSEVMTPKKMMGLMIGVCAFLPELLLEMSGSASMGVSGIVSQVAMMGAIIATVYGWIIMRTLLQRGYSPHFINGIAMVGGGMLSLIVSSCTECWAPVPVQSWYHFFYLGSLIALLNDLLFYNLYGKLLARYTATFLSFAGFILPIITALFGFIFLQEVVTWRFFYSLIFVSFGLWLFYYEELRQGYVV